MSEPKLIHPMLDDFAMGEPMSAHHGIRCCPAINKVSDKKYIVKIISIPASQVQTQALLLAGAYPTEAAALSYYRELADATVKEAKALLRLSRVEGFLTYDSYQIIPMEGEVGYDVYLLSPYRQSLEYYFRKHPVTYLDAVNLGLDLCAALAVCRRAGLLYVDLKPENVFVSPEREFRIGDLGFVSMSSLKYASLPDKYISSYTAPEIKDAMSTLNSGLDIYAAGLILYQAYNGGKLPFTGRAPAEPLQPPKYADEEMAAIILKACDPDPANRWEDPLQMGQEIQAYMQRNGVNDEVMTDSAGEEPEGRSSDAKTSAEAMLEELLQKMAEGEITFHDEDGNPTRKTEEDGTPAPRVEAEDFAFLDALASDDADPDEEYGGITEEATDILSQVDALIAHQTPEPVVAPEPIDVPVPPPIPVEKPEPTPQVLPGSRTLVAPAKNGGDTKSGSAARSGGSASRSGGAIRRAGTSGSQNLRRYDPQEAPKKKRKFPVALLVIVILLAVAAFGWHWFYNNYYLQTVQAISVSGEKTDLTVNVATDADEALIYVTCSDIYGNKREVHLENGQAEFNHLTPNTIYQIEVQIEGFHRLTGTTSYTYTTPAQINIVSFIATAGAEDGAVILNFTVDGKDPETWNLVYSAEGEEEKTTVFSGHMVTLNGLTVGKEYTFRLIPDSSLFTAGYDTLTYFVQPLIYAQDLEIVSCQDQTLTAKWSAPEGAQVESWEVHCYNDNGFDQTITVNTCEAVFTDLDTTAGYTVEVTAPGMMAGSRASITANSVTLYNFQADLSDPRSIQLSWDFNGPAPDGGWLVLYSFTALDGNDVPDREEVLRTETNSAVLAPAIPNSAYSFTIQAADGSTVFQGNFTSQTPDAPAFHDYDLTPEDFVFVMCVAPDAESWTYGDVPMTDYTNTFTLGQKAAILGRTYSLYNYDWDEVTTLYIIRNQNGDLISANTQARTWVAILHGGYCELAIPVMPEAAGEYTVSVYFDGAFVTEQSFTVVEAEEAEE